MCASPVRNVQFFPDMHLLLGYNGSRARKEAPTKQGKITGRNVGSVAVGVFASLCLFQVKHFLADFVLQGPYILENRKHYGHPGGLLHVAIHLAGSLIALLIVGTGTTTLAVLLLVEGVIHYHMDWAKDNFVAHRGLTSRDAAFWYVTGFDQAVHHLTYIGMAAYWAAAAI